MDSTELHYNWFIFSIMVWTTNNYLNDFKKNNRIFNLINNFIIILFIGVSINFNQQTYKYHEFLIYSFNNETLLDIFSIFTVYLNIGFILLDLVINRNIIHNLSMLILLLGYVYGGYFSYFVYVYFSFQFLEIFDNVIFLFKIKNKYIDNFNLFFRFVLTYFILFCWMLLNIASHDLGQKWFPWYINELIIPFYWNFIGSIAIFLLIFYNISIIIK
jgi:hypothetical protein